MVFLCSAAGCSRTYLTEGPGRWDAGGSVRPAERDAAPVDAAGTTDSGVQLRPDSGAPDSGLPQPMCVAPPLEVEVGKYCFEQLTRCGPRSEVDNFLSCLFDDESCGACIQYNYQVLAFTGPCSDSYLQWDCCGQSSGCEPDDFDCVVEACEEETDLLSICFDDLSEETQRRYIEETVGFCS